MGDRCHDRVSLAAQLGGHEVLDAAAAFQALFHLDQELDAINEVLHQLNLDEMK